MEGPRQFVMNYSRKGKDPPWIKSPLDPLNCVYAAPADNRLRSSHNDSQDSRLYDRYVVGIKLAS